MKIMSEDEIRERSKNAAELIVGNLQYIGDKPEGWKIEFEEITKVIMREFGVEPR